MKVTKNPKFNTAESKNNRNYEVMQDEQGSRVTKRYTKTAQDPFWYAFNQNDINNFANLPWSEIIGGRTTSGRADATPAFLAYDYAQTVGAFAPNAVDGESVIDRVATSLFGDYVKGWSQGVKFQAPDLVMAFIAGAALLTLIEEGKRAYGATTAFVLENNYYGRNLVSALGFDYDSIVNDKANFRSRMNIAIEKFNKTVPVPAQMTIAARWRFLAQFLFSDTDSINYSTLIGYKARKILYYDATSAVTGTCLRWREIPTTLTADSYFTLLDFFFDKLNDDDVRSMFVSIKNAGSDAMIKVDTIGEDFTVPVVRNDVVATAFHNARFFNPDEGLNVGAWLPASYSSSGADLFDVALYQDTKQKLISDPYVLAPTATTHAKWLQAHAGDDDIFCDAFDGQTSPGYVLDYTANMTVVDKRRTELERVYENAFVAYNIVCRSEVILAATLYTNATYNGSNFDFHGEKVPSFIDTSATVLTDSLVRSSWMTHIDSHPLLELVNANGTTVSRIGEYDRYTFIAKKALKNMHRNAFWRMINIP